MQAQYIWAFAMNEMSSSSRCAEANLRHYLIFSIILLIVLLIVFGLGFIQTIPIEQHVTN